MAEVPRIVRERLRSQVAAGEHPDANLLSAFAERALTGQEREQMLDHLSRCPECREVVALSALPQVEEERLEFAGRVSAGASRSWWRSPIVHWSALTAAALVVLIAVGERMRLRQGHSASAPAIARYEPAQKSETQAPATAPAPPERKDSQKLAPTAEPPRHVETFNAPKPMGAVSGEKVAPRGGAPPPVATSNAAAAPAPPAVVLKKLPPPTASYAGAGATEEPQLEKERKIDQAQVKGAPAPSAASKEAVEVTDSLGVTASAAPAPKTEATILSQRSGASFAKRAALGPRWSVSDSGALQRSFDGGRSWKDVAVAEGATFRAVAVVVNDVWAGGSGGALFHSADRGEHWARVRVQVNGRTPSGDIVRIEFADPQNGVVTTSTGETWTTSDASATWRWQ